MKIVLYEDVFREQVISLVLGIQNGEAKLGLTLEEQPDLQDIKGYFLSDGGFWVAMDEAGSVIGCIGLQKKKNACGVLKKFFVAEPFRGSEFGVSTALFNTLVDHARYIGMMVLILDTPAVASRSHAFYHRAGFIRISRTELPVEYDFPDRDSLLFMKRLD